uniref:Uncharacterized protein n=1 Tax=Anguilla anguilla TaxID=7936 RepID=A0A0E9UIV6_ANGAN
MASQPPILQIERVHDCFVSQQATKND